MKLQNISKSTWAVIGVLAALGFTDATYLAINHFMGKIPPCTISGCEVVTTSEYATILGVPIALIGALYYAAVLMLLMWYIEKKDGRALEGILYLVSIGALVSLGLVYLQLFVIKAICIYCMVSASTSFLMCIVMWYQKKKAQVVSQ